MKPCPTSALGALLLCAALALLGGCSSLPARLPAPESHALADVAETPLGQLAASHGTARTRADDSGVRLLPEAAFSFDARIALARHARKSLDVQYYLLENDEVGLLLLRELAEAAARGVRVRVIVDDLYLGDNDELFASFAALPNVELRLFNPLPARGGGLVSRVLRSLHEFGRINHRMHNKLFIADNSFSVSGGRNIGREYFMRGSEANFIDMDVLATGPAVHEQSASFDRYWNSAHVYPISQVVRTLPASAEAARQRFDAFTGGAAAGLPTGERDVLGRSSVTQQLAQGRLELFWAPVRVFADDPDKITRQDTGTRFAGSVSERTLEVIRSAESRVVIISPYFIPGDIGMGMIKASSARGVVTVVLTNSLGATDEPLVYAGYARYRDDMLRQGVIIYEFGPTLSRQTRQYGNFGDSLARLHAKMALIDDRRMFIGSLNLDGRSASLNTEIGLVIDSPEVMADFEPLKSDRFTSAYLLRLGPTGRVEWVEQTADGRQITHHDEPGTSWIMEIKNWLVSPFVREELL
jgi:putative cardiolipin synthase